MRAVSSFGTSLKDSAIRLRVWGHVPSGWGKSLPHMKAPTPISWRRSISSALGVEAPTKMLVPKNSLGRREIVCVKALPILAVVCPPRNFSSMRLTMPGSHQAPSSVMAKRRPGWRSKAPPQSSTHSGRAAHHQASVA